MDIPRIFFSTTAMIALSAAIVTPAPSQTTPGPAAAATPATPPAAETAQDGIADLVVTAQRREENVQKASIAISVLTPAELLKAGITQVQNLAQSVPGLQIGQGGAATQIYIRGVGDFGSTTSTQSGRRLQRRWHPRPRPAGIEGNFYDLERVEVLKGRRARSMAATPPVARSTSSPRSRSWA